MALMALSSRYNQVGLATPRTIYGRILNEEPDALSSATTER